MSATRQGMSSMKIDQIVAQRVTDAIEAIAIYQAKIHMAHNSMNPVIRQETKVAGNANNKRKFEDQPKDNRVPQQPPFKKPNAARTYTTGTNKKNAYAGNLPYCNKCRLHHVGPCTVKCDNCKGVGHMTRNCKTLVPPTNHRANLAKQNTIGTCYECGIQGHYKKDCLRLKNQTKSAEFGKEKLMGI